MVTDIGFFGDIVGTPEFKDGKMQITIETKQISLARFEQFLEDIKTEIPSMQVKSNFPSVP